MYKYVFAKGTLKFANINHLAALLIKYRHQVIQTIYIYIYTKTPLNHFAVLVILTPYILCAYKRSAQPNKKGT